jgi:hypothetical protein
MNWLIATAVGCGPGEAEGYSDRHCTPLRNREPCSAGCKNDRPLAGRYSGRLFRRFQMREL